MWKLKVVVCCVMICLAGVGYYLLLEQMHKPIAREALEIASPVQKEDPANTVYLSSLPPGFRMFIDGNGEYLVKRWTWMFSAPPDKPNGETSYWGWDWYEFGRYETFEEAINDAKVKYNSEKEQTEWKRRQRQETEVTE